MYSTTDAAREYCAQLSIDELVDLIWHGFDRARYKRICRHDSHDDDRIFDDAARDELFRRGAQGFDLPESRLYTVIDC